MSDVSFGAGGYSKAYFDKTFGDMGIYEEQVYAGGIDKYDYDYSSKNIESINKSIANMILKERGTATSETATGTSYSSTSGSVPTLIPIWVSPDIINLSRKETPLYELLPKVAIRGKFYDWNKAQFATNNAAFKPEDSAQAEYDDTYTRVSVPMKYCYAVGRVTGPMQIASAGYIDMERQEIMMKSRALLQKIENEIINGAVATDPDGFNGLTASITTNSTTQSAAISIDAIRTSILHAKQGGETYSAVTSGGNPNLIVTDLQTINDIKGLLQAYLRYNGPMVSIAWGLQAIEFEGIPIIASKFMTTTTTSKSLFVLDTSVVKLGVALDITMERLAKTNDSNKFMLKWYGALLVLVENWCAQIITIT